MPEIIKDLPDHLLKQLGLYLDNISGIHLGGKVYIENDSICIGGRDHYMIEDGMLFAVESGNTVLLDILSKKFPKLYDYRIRDLVIRAAVFNRIELIKLFHKQKVLSMNFYEALPSAIRENNIKIVNLCIKFGPDMGEHNISWEKRYIRNLEGENNFDITLLWASEKGYIKIAKLCVKISSNNIIPAAYIAAKNGHIKIVKLFREYLSSDYYPRLAECAAYNDHIDIIKLCKTWGVEYFDDAFESAARNGHIKSVKLCYKLGVKCLDRGFINAVKHGHIEIVELIKGWEVSNALLNTNI
jgi:ankyrin repeat protein